MKQTKNKTITYLFYFAYMFLLWYSMAGHIFILQPIFKYTNYVSMAILSFLIIAQAIHYTKKEFLISTILIIYSFLFYYRTKDASLLKIVLVIMAMKNVDFGKCILLDFKARILGIIGVYTLMKLGYVTDKLSYFDGTWRHSLGFTNPNTLGMHIMILVFEILYFNKEKVSIWKLTVSFFILFAINYYAGCRTINLLMIISCIIFTIYKYFPNILNKKIIKSGIINSPIIFFIITFIFFYLYKINLPLGETVNNLLSNRLMNIVTYSQYYSINIFGNNLDSLELTLDTFYAYLIYGTGILGTIFTLYVFRKLFIELYKRKETSLIIIFFIFMIYGFSERIWVLIDYNIFMSCFAFLVFSNKEKTKEKKGLDFFY